MCTHTGTHTHMGWREGESEKVKLMGLGKNTSVTEIK